MTLLLAYWQYQTYINKWLNYCCERELDSLHPSVADVIQFLTTLFEKNLSYSSLNTARSALSTIITVDGMSIGEICPEMHALAKMAEMAINRQNRQTINKNSNEMAKGPFAKWRFWRKWHIWLKWQKWRLFAKIAKV